MEAVDEAEGEEEEGDREEGDREKKNRDEDVWDSTIDAMSEGVRVAEAEDNDDGIDSGRVS